jgi:hypothetical protein
MVVSKALDARRGFLAGDLSLAVFKAPRDFWKMQMV